MIKRRKGFTLIELLAVIVILSIIALITVPIVLKMVEDSKRGAFKNSAYGIIEAAEYNYSWDLMDKKKPVEVIYKYSEGEETVTPNDRKNLDYKGDKPWGGEVRVSKEGKIAMAIHNGHYCVTKKISEEEVTLNDTMEDLDSNCKIEFIEE